jgi:ribosomal protein S26
MAFPGYCDNCTIHSKLIPLRVAKKGWFSIIFSIGRKYDPEGEEGIYVCHECRTRMIRTYELKDVDMNDILDDLPF